ncbi:hypothetical protein ACH3VR_22640 [Microbacterium sp. B2969]|uniref:Uncharacterized protein n=1 Tax=Microbacterium alkaliflavum TaxID=3248839 RepID=A0ABW7QE43_9MICO
MHGDQHEEGAGEEKLRQRGERDPDRTGPALRLIAEHPQRRWHHEGGGDRERDDDGEAGEGGGHAECPPDAGADFAAADPGAAEVAVQDAGPPAEAGGDGATVEAEFGADGGERLGGGFEFGVAGPEH